MLALRFLRANLSRFFIQLAKIRARLKHELARGVFFLKIMMQN
jgi:hypothetical protein